MSSGAPTSRAGRLGKYMLNLWAVGAMVYLFIPIVWIVVFSFNKPNGKYNITWTKFTWSNWTDPFSDAALTSAMRESLKVAAISTTIATVLGSLIAISLSRYKFRGSGTLNLLLVLPLTTPEIVLGSSLATLFIGWYQDFGVLTVVIAHVMFQISFVALTVRARVRGFDWTLEQAAQDLGATPLRTFWKVTFPMIMPGIAAAALLSFALSIDDFIITLFNAGSLRTFPLQINGEFKTNFSPAVNVLATVILAFSIVVMSIGTLRGLRKSRSTH